jgi:hypothetical protein
MRKLSIDSYVAVAAFGAAGMPMESVGRSEYRSRKARAVPDFKADVRKAKNKAAKMARARNRK